MSTAVVTVTPWKDAVKAMRWHPGEHVTLIGPTGYGKTELLISLLAERQYKVFINTKNTDRTQDRMLRGYQRTSDPMLVHPDIARAHLFSPRKQHNQSADELKAKYRTIYQQLLMRLRDQGGWTLGLDEIRFITSTLRLQDEMEVMWLQARSEDISIVANTQRPRHVPLEAYSMARHLFIWKTTDDGDMGRLSELVPNLNFAEIEAWLRAQGEHDALYVNVRTGTMLTTNTRE